MDNKSIQIKIKYMCIYNINTKYNNDFIHFIKKKYCFF